MRSRRYENTRNSGGIGSPPTDCRSLFKEDDHVGGCGALRRRVDFFGQVAGIGPGSERPSGLAAKPHPVPRRKLCDEQQERTRRDPAAWPVGGRIFYRLWTCGRVATSDRRDVRSDVPRGPCRPVAARLGLSAAKAAAPSTRARRSGHRAVAPRGLAANQKRGARRKASIVFLDESGFQLQPLNRRTWAPRGQRPEQRALATPRAVVGHRQPARFAPPTLEPALRDLHAQRADAGGRGLPERFASTTPPTSDRDHGSLARSS